jgi:membrane dipeptidase
MPGDYSFALSSEQEARALKLHRTSFSVDMCSMGPGGPALFAQLPQDVVAERLPDDVPPIVRFALGMLLPYMFTAEGISDALEPFCKGHTAASFALGGVTDLELGPISRLNEWIERIPWMDLARTAEDFRRAQREGSYVTYGFCQPSLSGLPRDLGQFDKAKELGVRSVMLTYNRQDLVGAGCTERTNAGLSYYGLEVVEKLNDIGLIVDTSHCGRQTTLDACRFSKAPVTANHTSAEALYPHARAKSDAELRTVADTGGVIGVYAMPFCLAPAASKATVETMLDHLDHVVRIVGWEHVGIGTDWPFMLSVELAEETIGRNIAEMGFRPEHEIGVSQSLVGYEDARDFVNITRGLVARGYEDRQIKGILGENFLRVFEAVCG